MFRKLEIKNKAARVTLLSLSEESFNHWLLRDCLILRGNAPVFELLPLIQSADSGVTVQLVDFCPMKVK